MLGLPWTKLEEQRSVINFLLLESGKTLPHLSKIAGFSKACISRPTFYSWFSQLREGRASVTDKPRSRRPAEAMTLQWAAEAVTPSMAANVEFLSTKIAE